MSRGAIMSIMGLYNNDNTVLDLMEFPDDFTDAQKQITKENILLDCAELEFLYPAPIVAKSIIGIWSRKEKPYWDRVYKASLAEYDPIENYKRNETETITDGRTEEHSGNDVSQATGTDSNARTGTETNVDRLSGDDQVKHTGSDTNTASGSDTNSGSSSSTDTNGGTDTVTNKITGYDSGSLVDHDSSATLHGHTVSNSAQGTNTQQYGRVDTMQRNTTDKTEYGKVDTDTLTLNTLETYVHGKTDTLTHGEKIEHEGNTERSLLAFGNIGTMTSQDMLTQELELAKIINVIPIIIDSFKNRFCIQVY